MAGIDVARFQASGTAPKPSYADAAYWLAWYNERGNEVFDWYLRWEQLKDIVGTLLSPESQILVLGCGTSALSEQMYAEGFVNITNVDRCGPLIDILHDKHQDKATMQYEEYDLVQALPREWDGRFDFCIDKATLDCVACGRDKKQRVDQFLRNVSRVMKPSSGVLVSISHAAPEYRRSMLLSSGSKQGADLSDEYRWRLSHQSLAKPLVDPSAADAKGGPPKDQQKLEKSAAFKEEDHVYHVYVCQKL
mmetsp:Transcript_10204/g.21608  ORF Transcript_10204/g.21608 Transcript_10204/m.21608 type:complete len:249 (-) Transcript_10204:60-806(-)